MGLLDKLFGSDEGEPGAPSTRQGLSAEDQRALDRYRYLLRTAPPETIEQVHAEAFAKLTDEQRAEIYEELSRGAATGERPLSSEPATLARAATRAEMRAPGTLERSFSGPGLGGMFASSLLGTVAGFVIGSALVSAFLPWDAGNESGNADSANADSEGANSADADADADADANGSDPGADFGAESDFGGGDFGF